MAERSASFDSGEPARNRVLCPPRKTAFRRLRGRYGQAQASQPMHLSRFRWYTLDADNRTAKSKKLRRYRVVRHPYDTMYTTTTLYHIDAPLKSRRNEKAGRFVNAKNRVTSPKWSSQRVLGSSEGGVEIGKDVLDPALRSGDAGHGEGFAP